MSNPSYDRYYELEQVLQQEAGLIPAPVLYAFDDDRIYAAILNRLAQTLPSGMPSPFSAQNPGTATSLLVSNLVYLQSLLAHEFNLVPDLALIEWLRLLGTRLRIAEYPVIELRFFRTQAAIERNIKAEIPIGLEVYSRYDNTLSAIVMNDARIEQGESIVVPARLSRLGEAPAIRPDEFNALPPLMSFLAGVQFERIVSIGRPAETIGEAVGRTRDWLKTGDRCVDDRDYYFFAMQTGAKKINVIRGRSPDTVGRYRDLRCVAVFPPEMTTLVESALAPRKLRDERLQVVPAQVVPIDGRIVVKAVASLSELEAWNLAASAISFGLNPPAGIWGDRVFHQSVADVLERAQGIYAAPIIELKHALTGVPLKDLDIEPWQLLEVQQTVQIEVLR